MASVVLDWDARYRVEGWPGVAVRVVGYVQRWEPWEALFVDEDGDEYVGEVAGEGEWVDDLESGRVFVVMVGDDARHEVDAADLVELDELAFCAECGQIGCSHDGRDRSEVD